MRPFRFHDLKITKRQHQSKRVPGGGGGERWKQNKRQFFNKNKLNHLRNSLGPHTAEDNWTQPKFDNRQRCVYTMQVRE